MLCSKDYLWLAFRKIGDSAECRICHKKLKRKDGQTSSLWYHIEHVHEEAAESLKKNGRLPLNEENLLDHFSYKHKLPNKKTDSINAALIELLSSNNLALRLVNTPAFQKFVGELNASYLLPKDHDVTKLIEGRCEDLKSMIREKLKGKTIGVTMDEWSSIKADVCILAIRAFYRCSAYKTSYTLACVSMERGHTAESYLELIEECFDQYHINPIDVKGSLV